MVGIGEAEELIHHAQIAWMPAEERRRYALTGPEPPPWFAAMQPAPWIDGHVLSEGRKLAGASLVRLPGDGVPAVVPPATPPPVPAQRRPDVPAGVPPRTPPPGSRRPAGPAGTAPRTPAAPQPRPRRGQDARWPALLDTASAAKLAIQAQDRRQPAASRGTWLNRTCPARGMPRPGRAHAYPAAGPGWLVTDTWAPSSRTVITR
ncbi:MAG TPA: hypothetical protein VFV73_43870 [Streptosporangiaceae bacterium]|nr:hypothetical protein [Streptosporangiaceae bacterium]